MKQAFVNGIILDGTADMVPVAGKGIFTENGIITDIREYDPRELTDCEVTDLGGAYICPGLINLHTHLASSGKAPKKNAKPVNYKALFDMLSGFRLVRFVLGRQAQSLAKTELLSGVTTLRALGGILDLDGKARDAIESGKALGPRILAANTAVSVPGGHFAGSLATEAVTAEDAAADVERIAATKPDVIKLMITGGVMDAEVVGEPGALRMKPKLVKAACEKAHALGYPVAAHVESPEGVKVALENGVDTIEHGAKPDKEILELFRSRSAALVATLSPSVPYALFDRSESHCTEEAQINGRVVMDGIIACAKACLEAGIPVGLGTDSGCPFITHYDMWRELVYFHKYCGVSNAFALHTATEINASIAGLSKITGTISRGKSADFIVCERNPLEDLTVLRQLRMVVIRGRVVKNPTVRKKLKTEALLDRFM